MFLLNETDLKVLTIFQQRRRDPKLPAQDLNTASSINDYVKNSLIVKSIDFSDINMINAQTLPQIAASSGVWFASEDFKDIDKCSKYKSMDNLKYNIM